MYILSKHRELLKHINIHEKAETFRRNLASNPPIFLFLFFENKSRKTTCVENKRQLVEACRVKANLTSGREVYLYQDRK
jgi:hypothetical protein